MTEYDNETMDSDMMMDESSGPETIETPVYKLEAGQSLWVRRGDTTPLLTTGFYFRVVEYDDDWARVEIKEHADAEKEVRE